MFDSWPWLARRFGAPSKRRRTGDDSEGSSSFALLPDDVLQHIAGILGPLETLQHARLHQVNRRWAAAVAGMEWQKIDLVSGALECGGDGGRSDPFMEGAPKALAEVDGRLRASTLRRMSSRADAGDLRGVRELRVCVGGDGDALAALRLLYGLARCSPGLEAVEVAFPTVPAKEQAALRSGRGGGEANWVHASELFLALGEFRALRSLALGHDTCSFFNWSRCWRADRIAGLFARLGGLASLRITSRHLTAAEAASLVAALPRLTRLGVAVRSPEALGHLGGLPLEELSIHHTEARWVYDGGLMALAGGVAGGTLRRLALDRAPLGPEGLQAVLRMRQLEALLATIAPVIGGEELASDLFTLPRLAVLSLRIFPGVSLLRAVAAGVERAAALRALDVAFAKSPRDAAGGAAAAELVRAARDYLRSWSCCVQGYCVSTEELAALAEGGPRLRRVEVAIQYPPPRPPDLEPLGVLSRLRDAGRRGPTAVEVSVFLPPNFATAALQNLSSALAAWLPVADIRFYEREQWPRSLVSIAPSA